jgi:hypothetical protein
VGIQFRVGVPRDVYLADYARAVDAELRLQFGCAFESPWHRRWSSAEVGGSWIEKFQQAAERAVGSAPHLAACNAWNTVYLPVPIEPQIVRPKLPPSRPRFAPPTREQQSVIEEVLGAAAKPSDAPPDPPSGLDGLVCAGLDGLHSELLRYAAREGWPTHGPQFLLGRVTARWGAAPSETEKRFHLFVELLAGTTRARRWRLPLWVVK